MNGSTDGFERIDTEAAESGPAERCLEGAKERISSESVTQGARLAIADINKAIDSGEATPDSMREKWESKCEAYKERFEEISDAWNIDSELNDSLREIAFSPDGDFDSIEAASDLREELGDRVDRYHSEVWAIAYNELVLDRIGQEFGWSRVAEKPKSNA